ncbi:MAG: cysteine--tRNA ligase [Candidatus Nomurabacteria bacterium]|nr:cysteine--tRNA ligase [Candidatus Nomurabacteria bacterium]
MENLKLYNSLSNTIQPFAPIKRKQVGVYSCGPTVYNYMHIGNLRAFMFADITKRVLQYNGFNVYHVMNITDVDDKTIRDSNASGMSLNDFTKKYTHEFFKDLDSINIIHADRYPRATEHVDQMITMIQDLIDGGYAYISDDKSVYYDISKYEKYGELSGIDKAVLQNDTRGVNSADEYDKDNAQDFALWKAYDSSDGDASWDSPWGRGRPGWHIECSAMATSYLGKHFDIHTGGIDLKFPHHENEIAQCVVCSGGEPFADYWLHNEHLMVDGKKMSKSMDNFYTLRDIIDRGHDPMAYRYFLLQGHYRTQINFTWESLNASETALKKLRAKIADLRSASSWWSRLRADIDQPSFLRFLTAINDDMNTSEALATAWTVAKDSTLPPAIRYKTLIDFDRVLGLKLEQATTKKSNSSDIPFDVEYLLKQRESARADKNWQLSDELRDKITDLGYNVKDTADGQEISKN